MRTRRRKFRDIPELAGKSKVAVGFPKGEAQGEIIERAIYNHFGTSRIPPRPFILVSIRENKSKYKRIMTALSKQIIGGEISMESAMRKLGIIAAGDVQKTIVELRDPPNAPSTIKRKGSDNPLIDTGAMRQAVTHKVIE